MKIAPTSLDLHLARGQILEDPGTGLIWQVAHGMLSICSDARTADASWRLALPGDWLNIESLCGLFPDARTTALVPSLLQPVPLTHHPATSELLKRLVRQQQQWAGNMLALRSGPVERRVQHLLDLMHQAGQRALPGLRDIATLVDAAPETTCRTLKKLRPQRPGPQSAAVRPVPPSLRPVLAGL